MTTSGTAKKTGLLDSISTVVGASFCGLVLSLGLLTGVTTLTSTVAIVFFFALILFLYQALELLWSTTGFRGFWMARALASLLGHACLLVLVTDALIMVLGNWRGGSAAALLASPDMDRVVEFSVNAVPVAMLGLLALSRIAVLYVFVAYDYVGSGARTVLAGRDD